jgi:hypothetical protein
LIERSVAARGKPTAARMPMRSSLATADCSGFSQRGGISTLTARDSKLTSPDVSEQMTERVVEIKRMPTGLIQKLDADRLADR